MKNELTAKFKDSPLGPIPQDWEVKRLGEIAPLQRGFDLPTSLLCKGDYPVVYSNGICNYHNEAMCNAPGLITGRSGTIGKFTFIATGKYWPHNTTLWVTNFNGNDPQFIYWMYSFIGFERFATGSGVPTLNRNAIHEYWAACPPLPEQRRIAEALGEMDRLIELLDAQIEKKRRIAQGLAHDLLGTGNGEQGTGNGEQGMRNGEWGMRNEPIRRLPGFKGEWERKRLGVIGKVLKGSGISRSESTTGNIPAVRYGEIYTHHNYVVKKYVSRISPEVAARATPLKQGDVVFAGSGETVEDIGKAVSILDDGVYAGGDTIIFSPRDKTAPLFWGHLMNAEYVQQQKALRGQGATIVHIRPSDIAAIEVLYPTIAEQRAIAEVLAAADEEISALEAKKGKYEQIRSGMMRDLLSGRVRI